MPIYGDLGSRPNYEDDRVLRTQPVPDDWSPGSSTSGVVSGSSGRASRISDIKVATPDIILENTISASPVQALFLENISSKELISIVRNDVVNGKAVAYNPIKNLASLGIKYGPKTLVPLQGSSDTYFNNFPIKLERKVPEVGTGPFGEIVYIDYETNDLIVNVINLADDERVEVQIMKRGQILDDTIYTEGNI